MQQRKKRIKTTTCNTQFTARFVGSAVQNRKRNPPEQRTEATAVRSTSATTKQTNTDANKNIVRQSQHASAPAVARSCSVRRQIHSRTVGIRSPRKEAHRPAAPVDDPTNQAEKNSRTNHTNKQTRRKTLRQHSTRRHKSALCYKIQTHASHRVKKQKPVLIRISQENLPKAREKHRKILRFT